MLSCYRHKDNDTIKIYFISLIIVMAEGSNDLFKFTKITIFAKVRFRLKKIKSLKAKDHRYPADTRNASFGWGMCFPQTGPERKPQKQRQ